MYGMKSKRLVRLRGSPDMNEPFDIKRNCGNCLFFKSHEDPDRFGVCNYPIPTWLLLSTDQTAVVEHDHGHNCDCHKLKD